MTKDEALKLALEALEFYYDLYKEKVDANAITAIKEALAQSDDLTIAYMSGVYDGKNKYSLQSKPLTDEQIDELSRTMVKGNKSVNWLARAIEGAHGIKGEE